jgi:hypothetical protein
MGPLTLLWVRTSSAGMDFNGKVGQCTVEKDKSIDDKRVTLAVVSYPAASEEDERHGVAGEDMTVTQRTGARCLKIWELT